MIRSQFIARGYHTSTIPLGQTLARRREKKEAKKSGGKKPDGGKKKGGAKEQTVKKIKMKDSEFFSKIEPIVVSLENFDSFDISTAIFENQRGIFRESDRSPLIGFPEDTHYDIQNPEMDNVRFREGLAEKFVPKLMHMHCVSPDIVEAFSPRIKLLITYPLEKTYVVFGNEIPPLIVKDKPEISFLIPKLGFCYWTLFCVGRDRDGDVQRVHWIVANFFSAAQNGTTILDYIPPSPAIGEGLLQYIFLLCSHKSCVNITEVYEPGVAAPFNAKEFMKKYNMVPKGISFLHTKYHPSVPGPQDRLNFKIFDDEIKSKEQKVKTRWAKEQKLKRGTSE